MPAPPGPLPASAGQAGLGGGQRLLRSENDYVNNSFDCKAVQIMLYFTKRNRWVDYIMFYRDSEENCDEEIG